MKVSIVGTGYVGLVSGACLADRGHTVTCVDVDQSKVAMINSARAPIHENGLNDLLKRHSGKTLFASTNLAAAVTDSEMTFIAVGTPAAGGKIDLRFVEGAAAEIGAALRTKSVYHTVIVKSTVVPGTTVGVVLKALETASGKKAGKDFGLGMNPEFLTEGTAVEDFSRPDRLVFGGVDQRTLDTLARLYESFDAAVPRIATNPSTAEMIKYASNAVLATMISFSNEIARLCSAVGGIDALDVMHGVHEATYFTARRGNERITASIASFLEAGCGFGGSCLPKDVTALIGQGRGFNLQLSLLQSVLDINRDQPGEMLRLIGKHFASLEGVRVATLGIAFKPDTDDTRESPAFPIIAKLKAAGALVSVYDPVVRAEQHKEMADITWAASLEAAVANAEVIVLVTRWSEFSQLAQLLEKLGRSPLVVDGRRMLDKSAFERYEGIGV
jgi:UDPglucose 6-dehydrogenase